MNQFTTHSDLQNQVEELRKILAKSKSHEVINRTLVKICSAIGSASTLKDFLALVQTILSELIDTSNFCVVLRDLHSDTLLFPYFCDATRPTPPSNSAPERTLSLAKDIIETGQPLLLDEEALLRYRPLERHTFLDKTVPKSWIGIPLPTQHSIIGALILQNYSDPYYFDQEDLEFLISLAKQIAMAIDHKLKEEELRHSEDHYRAIFQNSPLGILCFDHHGVILDCNDRSIKILGTMQSKLTGCDYRVLFPKTIQHALEQALAGQRSTFEDFFEIPSQSNHILLRMTFRPVSPESIPTNVICTLEDLTEKRQLEEAAKASAEQIKIFFSNLNDAIFVHPVQDEGFAPFIEVNDLACERYGYSRDEFLQMTVEDITEKTEVREHGSREHRSRLQKYKQLIFEAVHIKKSGERFPVEINANITRQYGRQVILAVARDISDRVEAQREKETLENRLHQAQKMESVGRLAGGVAHDFNNMLSVILGHTELLLEDMDEYSNFYGDIQKISHAAKHSAQLTKQLLAFARKQAIKPVDLDINAEIDSMLNMIGRLIGEDITLDWQPAEDIWPVLFDPSQVDQIITNLCLNARDAIDNTGCISITTENREMLHPSAEQYPGLLAGKYVFISVRDTGKGIAESDLPYIFEPFFTTKNLGEGTGLGLATVYGILKQNNAYIYANSHENHTEFSIFIPRHQRTTTVKSSLPPVEVGLQKGAATILVVEDEIAILDIVTTMLTRHGFRVIPSSSPEEALQIARNYSDTIDLLLTDVVMPEMNGHELSRELLALHPKAKCLYMSGYTSKLVTPKNETETELCFIQKPFTKKNLLQKIFSLL